MFRGRAGDFVQLDYGNIEAQGSKTQSGFTDVEAANLVMKNALDDWFAGPPGFVAQLLYVILPTQTHQFS